MRAEDPFSSGICSASHLPTDTKVIPPRFNWNELGYVNPEIYFQGHCSSCYIFATTGALESQYMIKVKKSPPIKLSEQELLDCLGNQCYPGYLFDPMQYMVNYGLTTYDKDPY